MKTKTEKIDTGLKVPSKYSYNRADSEYPKFKMDMVKALELPDDWAEYLEFRGTNDFVSVQENGSYKVEVFRRFKRDANAVIDQDLKDRLKKHIEYKKKRAEEEKNKKDTYKYHQDLIKDVMDTLDTDEWYLSLSSSLSIEVILKNGAEALYWRDSLGKCTITHSGVITEPTFEGFSSYSTYPISKVQQWINEKQPLADKIIAKAQEIKAALPTEFFKTDSHENKTI